MKLQKTEEWDEEDGNCLFFSFSRGKDGNVLGEPPETEFLSGYLSDDFDPEKWTHFIKGIDFNFVFEQADPKSFPRVYETPEEKCIWSQEEEEGQDWVSSCGTSFTFNDDAPSDNGFRFCPKCSKPLEEHYHTVDPTDCDQTM